MQGYCDPKILVGVETTVGISVEEYLEDNGINNRNVVVDLVGDYEKV